MKAKKRSALRRPSGAGNGAVLYVPVQVPVTDWWTLAAVFLLGIAWGIMVARELDAGGLS